MIHEDTGIDTTDLRQQAEVLWLDNGYDTRIAQSPEELRQQIKDLQIMHIELELRNQALQSSIHHLQEERLQYEEIAKIGRWELDIPSSQLKWSESIFAMFEIDSSVFPATYEAFLNAIHPDDRDMVNSAYTNSLVKKTPYNIYHRLLMQDGRIKWVNEVCRTIFDDAGNPLRSIGIVHDITSIRQASETIMALNATLEQKVKDRTAELAETNKELDSFSRTIAHDLQTPLRSINAWITLLKDEWETDLPEAVERNLNNISAEVVAMTELIEALLKLSRLVKAPLHLSNCNLSEMASSIVEQLRHVYPDITPQVRIEDNVLAVGDASLLRDALRNLLDNAWKFSLRSPSPQICFGTVVNNGVREFYVSDRGAGFDMQHAEQLFQPFHRLHKASEFPGTGVGLASVKKIITRHKGDIRVESTPGEGTTFYFTLNEHIPSSSLFYCLSQGMMHK